MLSIPPPPPIVLFVKLCKTVRDFCSWDFPRKIVPILILIPPPLLAVELPLGMIMRRRFLAELGSHRPFDIAPPNITPCGEMSDEIFWKKHIFEKSAPLPYTVEKYLMNLFCKWLLHYLSTEPSNLLQKYWTKLFGISQNNVNAIFQIPNVEVLKSNISSQRWVYKREVIIWVSVGHRAIIPFSAAHLSLITHPPT